MKERAKDKERKRAQKCARNANYQTRSCHRKQRTKLADLLTCEGVGLVPAEDEDLIVVKDFLRRCGIISKNAREVGSGEKEYTILQL